MSSYFVKRNGRVVGPYSGTQLVNAAKSGKLIEIDEIGNGQDGPWTQARSVPNLQPYFSDIELDLTPSIGPANENMVSPIAKPSSVQHSQQSINPDNGNTVLVVSLVGLIVPFLCFLACYLGAAYVRQSRRQGLEPGSAGKAGRIIAIISSLVWVISLVFIVSIFFVFMAQVSSITREKELLTANQEVELAHQKWDSGVTKRQIEAVKEYQSLLKRTDCLDLSDRVTLYRRVIVHEFKFQRSKEKARDYILDAWNEGIRDLRAEDPEINRFWDEVTAPLKNPIKSKP